MHRPTTALLKPATAGLRVTIPGTREVLPFEGAELELSSYWRERIRDGSVVLVEEEAAEPLAEARRKPRATHKQD